MREGSSATIAFEAPLNAILSTQLRLPSFSPTPSISVSQSNAERMRSRNLNDRNPFSPPYPPTVPPSAPLPLPLAPIGC